MSNATLKSFIAQRIDQLESRKRSINYFLNSKEKGLGKVKHTKQDLITIEFQINESKAVLKSLKSL